MHPTPPGGPPGSGFAGPSGRPLRGGADGASGWSNILLNERRTSMLKGKTALVTGSTSGIGLGVALSLARQGANVVLNGFGDSATPQAQVAEAGVKVGFHGADMSKPGDIAAMMAYAQKEFGGVDVLVNNAGIQH